MLLIGSCCSNEARRGRVGELIRVALLLDGSIHELESFSCRLREVDLFQFGSRLRPIARDKQEKVFRGNWARSHELTESVIRHEVKIII